MEVNDLFANEQHGFVPKRDCMTNLLIAMEKWTQVIEDGGNIDIIYTDFAKAFDSVPHKRLLTKIESLGIRGDILQWIKAFLVGRKQKVCVDGVHSSWNPVKSGIPQGSVLGPLLFVIYINDMPTKIKSLCLLFADDAKIYNENSNVLQEDMKKLSEWSYKWQLPFNIKKCKSLHIGGKNNHHLYTMNDQELDQVTEEKDLGIIIDENFKFYKHTAAAAKKANFILGLIKRSFASLDSNILPLLYKALVRPHLEYGNLIWGPHFKGDQIKLEKIQRRATKLVPGIKDLTYEERMRALRLPSLAYRRKRGDMLQTYKILTNKVNLNPQSFFQFRPHPTRGHRLKIYKERATKLPKIHSFSTRIVNNWNKLTPNVTEANDINEFKRELDKHWIDIKYETD